MENNDIELNETTKNFLEAFAMHNWDTKPEPPVFKCYYDDNGHPTGFEMVDLPGNFLVIDRETFLEADYNIRIVDGKITKPEKNSVNKLNIADSGVPTAKENVSIVVDKDEPNNKWSMD